MGEMAENDWDDDEGRNEYDPDDKGDWLHEVKRDKRLDRIVELEAEVARWKQEVDRLLRIIEHARDEAIWGEGCKRDYY
jgi:hypothetical protein